MTTKKMSIIFDWAILLLAIYLKVKAHRDIHMGYLLHLLKVAQKFIECAAPSWNI